MCFVCLFPIYFFRDLFLHLPPPGCDKSNQKTPGNLTQSHSHRCELPVSKQTPPVITQHPHHPPLCTPHPPRPTQAVAECGSNYKCHTGTLTGPAATGHNTTTSQMSPHWSHYSISLTGLCPVARHSTPISTSHKRDWGFTRFHSHLHPASLILFTLSGLLDLHMLTCIYNLTSLILPALYSAQRPLTLPTGFYNYNQSITFCEMTFRLMRQFIYREFWSDATIYHYHIGMFS